MKKGIIFLIIFGLFINITAGASLISFYVVEAGLSERENVQHAQIWEDAFLDVFFEAGYIVTNAPILRLQNKPNGDILGAVAFDAVDVSDGGIDYVLIAILDYTGNLPAPGEISFYIFKVIPRGLIYEKKIEGKTFRNMREELEDAKSIVRGLVPYIEGSR
ncbi:MAG: hypothetical protein FWD28_06780 [Treponema sp.]|nr:hypothetical protein [Treponema sp.]